MGLTGNMGGKTRGNLAVSQPDGQTLSPAEFVDLYERHQAAVYRSALRVTGNPADAEDVLQTVFLRLYTRGIQGVWGKSPRDTRTTDAYFRRAAANAAIDILRRRAIHAEIQIDETQTKTRPHLVQKPETLLKEQLRRALAKLPPEDAELFLMRFVEGFSNGELAGLLGQEKNNVAVRLHRIRQALQEELKN